MKRILITNDDGFDSPALLALRDALSPLGHCVIVAPASEKSACGHSMTLTRPMRFVRLGDDFYKLDDGSPTDCVYLALNALYDNPPDLLVSGINIGSNMGEDVSYSGTAGAAMEGALHEIPSIAFSQILQDKNYDGFDFALAKEVAFKLAKAALDGALPLGRREFLNVNIPQITPKECRGIVATAQGRRVYGNDAHVHRNPRGQEFYWLGLHPLAWENTPLDLDVACLQGGAKNGSGVQNGGSCGPQNGGAGSLQASSSGSQNGVMSDFDATAAGFVSVTPLTLDFTAHRRLGALNAWLQG